MIRLLNEDQIAMCWYKWKRKSSILVLVEDQMSAIKLAPHYHSAALMGTNFSEEKVLEVMYSDQAYDHVYLCLDPDATQEAIRTQLRWRARMPNLRVAGLQKDIKDMSDEELKEFLARLV